jgi:4-amino-4-deoxy-L-arabinose transferase-like glycosyltransferase
MSKINFLNRMQINFITTRRKNVFYVILIVMAVTACMIQQLHDITAEPVKIWDEASGAQNAIEMLKNKNYFVVYNDGQPEHLDTKPPMALWFKVMAYKLFGINEFSVRLPSILANILIMLVFIVFAIKFLKNPMLSWMIPLLMASTYGYMDYHVARTGDPDTLLVLFVTCYMLSYIVLLEKYPLTKYKFLIFFGLSLTCAIYTKSIAGLAPAAGILLFTFIHPNGRKILLHPEIYLTGLGVVVFVSLYYIIRNVYDPGYLKAVFQFELNLFGGNPYMVKHPESGFYFNYLRTIAFKPFFSFIPLVIIPLIFSENKLNKRIILFSLVGGGFFLLGQSMSVTKNEWYISPIYPFLWLLVSVGLIELFDLIPKFISLRLVSMILQAILVIVILNIVKDQYVNTYIHNNKNPYGYVYEPERAGQYLTILKNKHPDVKELTVFINRHPRQVKYYAKKFNYEDSTNVLIITNLKSNQLIGKKVIVCDTILSEQLLKKFNCRVLDSTKYCKLYIVESQNIAPN